MGETSSDMLHGVWKAVGCEKKVDVVWHCDIGVEFVEALGPIVLEDVEKEVCVGLGLKEATPTGGDCGDEECAAGGSPWGAWP
jgi:hypothetical protein